MHVRIVCPEHSAYEGEAAFVALPSTDGELGILPRHAERAEDLASINKDEVQAQLQGFEEQLSILSEDDARRAYLYNEIAWCTLLLSQ